MLYKFVNDSWGSSFKVPSAVVNKYLKNTEGDYIKILLCILSGERIADSSEIADLCGVAEKKVLEAVDFWQKINVIILENQENSGKKSDDVIFAKDKAVPVSVVEAVNPTTDHNPPVNKKIVVNYTPKEIREKAENDNNFQHLLSDIQKLQFSVNNKEIGRLLDLYELYHFDVPTILLVADYCDSIGKRSIAYLATVMIDWYEDDIQSYADVEKKIIQQTALHKYENQVLNIFGMENKPSKKQKQYIQKWNDMGINKELLEIAYDKCIDKKKKLNFEYIDGIINNWSANKITTPEQVAISDENYKKENKFPKPENAKETSYNLDSFEKYAMDFSLYDDEGTEN